MKSTRRAFLSAGGASALALSLAACSRSKSQSSSAETQASGTPIAEPVLSDNQLTDVLERVQTGLDAADKEKNADKLQDVLSGPAARIRAAEYALASASGNGDFIHPLSTKSQGGGVGQTVGFPRNAATASEGDSPLILSLEQNSAREQFKLWAWVQGFSAQRNIPVLTKQTAQRAKQVTADSTGLVATPKAVLDAYVDALNNPEGDNGKAFPDDLMRQKIQSARTTDLRNMGEVTVTASAGTDGFQGLQLEEGDGAALVFTTLTHTVVYKRTVDGADLTLQGDVAALMGGNQKIIGTVTATYDSMVAFAIPKEGSGEQAAILGAETALIKVDRDDSQTPAPTASATPS